jgi:hypothetical protein
MNHTLAKLAYEAQRHKEEESKRKKAAEAETGKIRREQQALDSTAGSLGKVVDQKRKNIGG